MKICNTCGIEKPLSQYYVQTSLPGGRRHDCKQCSNLKVTVWVEQHPINRKHHTKSHRQKLRLAALDAYGRQCACCGEFRLEFLQIDHINGGGCKERKKRGSSYIYQWLKDNNYPPGFQVLCGSCNSSKGFYGYCPHELERQAILAIESKYPIVPELVVVN